MPLITIFASPKPFTNPHIDLIQRNAIQSWVQLGSEVEVFLMGQEVGLAEAAAELGVRHFPEVRRTPELKTPYVSSMIETARQNSQSAAVGSTGRRAELVEAPLVSEAGSTADRCALVNERSSPLLLCINADVILLPEFLNAARALLVWQKANPAAANFLMVGPRWDLDVRQPLDFSPGWDERLRAELRARGRTHPPLGSDYFLFPRHDFKDIPDFAMGRSAWDNWMIYHHRVNHWPVIDATFATNVIHQDHDYSHLPGSRPPYRLPETLENIRLAGGRRCLFYIQDADYRLHYPPSALSTSDSLLPVNEEAVYPERIPVRGKKILREIEIFPLVTLHSIPLAEATNFIYHPVEAFKEWRGRLAYKFKQLARRLLPRR